MEQTIHKYGCCLLCLLAGFLIAYAVGPKTILLATGDNLANQQDPAI
jgi:hypothetical protein